MFVRFSKLYLIMPDKDKQDQFSDSSDSKDGYQSPNNKKSKSGFKNNINEGSYKNTKNYSFTKIVSVMKTFSFLIDGTIDRVRSILYVINLNPNILRLKKQANVFATNFKTDRAYSFQKLFNCSDNDVVRKLENIYVYSYLKAVYATFFDNTLKTHDTGGFCFVGHSRLYALMQSKGYMTSEQNISTHVLIKTGSVRENKVKFALILKQFPEITKNLGPNFIIGEDCFKIFKFEELFSVLTSDYYAKRAGGEPEFLHDSTDFTEGANLANVPIQDNAKGKVFIVHLKNRQSLSIGKSDSNPLTNSFYNGDCSKLYHIEVNGSFHVRFNESFFFNLANFLTIDTKESDMDSINRCYKNIPISVQQDFLICSEVYVNTGVKPQFTSPALRSETGGSPFGGMPPSDLFKQLFEKLDRLPDLESILTTVDELIDEYRIIIEQEFEGGENKGK